MTIQNKTKREMAGALRLRRAVAKALAGYVGTTRRYKMTPLLGEVGVGFDLFDLGDVALGVGGDEEQPLIRVEFLANG